MGFAESYLQAREGVRSRDRLDAELADREQRMAWEREDRARKAGQQTEQDNAWRGLQTLQQDGMVGGATGLSQPSTQMAYAGNAGGYGAGAAAVKDMAGDFQRESNRFGLPQTYNGAADVTKRTAKKSELQGGMMDVARASRDLGAYNAAHGLRENALDDETMADVKLPKIGTPEFVTMSDQLVTHLNTNHKSVTLGEADKQGFRQLSVVGTNGKAVFEKLSQAEQLKLAQANALMERNPTKAMAMIESVNKNLAEAIAKENDFTLKTGDAENNAAFRQGSLKNDAARTAIAGAALGIQRDEQKSKAADRAAANWQIIGTTADKKGLLYFNKETQKTEARPLPEGTDAQGLFRKLTGERNQTMTKAEEMKARAELKTAGYSEPMIDSMISGVDPMDAIRAAVADKLKGKAAPPAAPAGGLQVPQGSTGQTNFGMLTSRALLEREVAAGNPAAIRYAEAMRQNEADLEASRGGSSFMP